MGSPLPEEFGVQLYGHTGSVKKKVRTLNDGTLAVSTELATIPGFNIPPYTKIEATYPTTTREIYTYKNGAATVAVITVEYTDDKKTTISWVEKT